MLHRLTIPGIIVSIKKEIKTTTGYHDKNNEFPIHHELIGYRIILDNGISMIVKDQPSLVENRPAKFIIEQEIPE